ncbi:MAG TPA: type-F conjugative transfer system mating-pair stabilization protein TraN [Arsenophonus nasoniae]|uniref:type-F conjugative transfer system mating-pair stabilization protein TraN n=1 Tax=Arsenophonus nasoniae TaxID=638 RepID=UPI0038790778
MVNRGGKGLSLLLIVGLISPASQANKEGDYRAGASFAKQVQKQGEETLKNAEPQKIIPNYHDNPQEADYYKGVTSGSDGNLKSEGATQWLNSDTGKAVNESLKHKPKASLSPDAPFIQAGREIEKQADKLIGSPQRCQGQKIAHSEFTHYVCERDTAVEQVCTRHATIEGTSETKTKTVIREYQLQSLPYHKEGRQIVAVITPDVDGTIEKVTYTYQGCYRCYHSVGISGMGDSFIYWLGRGGDITGELHVTNRQFIKGKPIPFSHNDKSSSGAYRFNQPAKLTLRFTLKVTESIFHPKVVWKESCPFNKSEGKLIKTECLEAGGNRTVERNGKTYSIYQACWRYKDTYQTQKADESSCKAYRDNPACTLINRKCAFTDENGNCLHENATFSCETRSEGTAMVCGGDLFCLDGSCEQKKTGQANDFKHAVSQLAAVAAAGKGVAASQAINVKAFTGEAQFCKKFAVGFSNCCQDSGWGHDIGLASCSEEEKALAKAKEKRLTVSVGEFCSEKVLGVCLAKKRSYCQFDSLLAQIIQQQGRAWQLGIGFGDPSHPDCRGITPEELQRIQFDNLDFSPFYADLMKNQRVPDNETLLENVKARLSERLEAAK